MQEDRVTAAPVPHPLSTKAAAERVGVPEDQFKTWARRRRLKPRRYVRLGRTSYAVWALEDVLAAQRTRPDNR